MRGMATVICGGFGMLGTVVGAHAAEPEFRDLFNGKNLDGWVGDGYAVEDGAIVCTPNGQVLHTEKIFSNYLLEFDFKLEPGSNNGLGIHYPGTGDGAYTGMELQILDNSAPQYKDLRDYQFHGSLYTLAAAKREGLKPVGDWNTQRVAVVGNTIAVDLNGTKILNADLAKLSQDNPAHEGVKRRSGHIAFLGHGDKVSFKNIRVSELPPAANDAQVKEAGFTKVFNGTNLDGWKHSEKTDNWTASNGILQHNGKPGEISDLWTEKEYGDVTIVFDWRWTGHGPVMDRPLIQPDGSTQGSEKVEELDSGIYLRGSTKSQVNIWNWPVGSGEVYGYRTDEAMSAEVRAGVTPKMKADKPLGEWNRMMVRLKGDRLDVTLNGKTVIRNAELPEVPERGPIGLQHHGAAIDFANIWIKEG